MKKKICLITGANSGIGFELARGMAQENYTTILLCRNWKSGDVARGKIISSTKNQEVYVMIADLSSQNSIRRFVNDFNSEFSHLDVLFSNAGANFFDRQITKDGVEMTFAVNYLAPFLLTSLLMPKLAESDSGKIIMTAGGISRRAHIEFLDINLEEKYNVVKASAQAILAKYLFCHELSSRIKASNITVNCFHPGATKTGLQKKMPVSWKLFIGLMRPFFQSAVRGAETGLYLATDEELQQVSGKCFKSKKEMKLPEKCREPESARLLWDVSEYMLAGLP